MKDISKVIKLCFKYYSNTKLEHCLKVAAYAMEEAQDRKDVKVLDAFIVGLVHDLVEDTECDPAILQEVLGERLMSSVNLLTKSDNEEYYDYVKDIYDSKDKLALLVKRADMRDHLTRTTTLTDKLKNKYFPVLHMLL